MLMKIRLFWMTLSTACGLLEVSLQNSYSDDFLKSGVYCMWALVVRKKIENAQATMIAKHIKQIVLKGAQEGKKKAAEKLRLPFP